jgi:hypothetical protein
LYVDKWRYAPVASTNITRVQIQNGTPGKGSSFALPGVPSCFANFRMPLYNEKPQAAHFCRIRFLPISVWRFTALNEPNRNAQKAFNFSGKMPRHYVLRDE